MKCGQAKRPSSPARPVESGLGIATALAGSGTNIVLNGFGPVDAIDKIVSDLKRQHNVGVLYSSANIADPDEIEDMVEQTRTEFGGVDRSLRPGGGLPMT